MSSRKIEAMHSLLKVKYYLFQEKMLEAHLSFILTCVSRDILEQVALYSQGRMSLSDVNIFRYMAKMEEIKEIENRKVTWTLNSKHVTNMLDTDLNNDLSKAFDIALLKYNRPHWDIKISVNPNEEADYLEAAKIGESVGLIAGARFKNPDYPHFEII